MEGLNEEHFFMLSLRRITGCDSPKTTGQPDRLPVTGVINATIIASGIDESLDQQNGVLILIFPVTRDKRFRHNESTREPRFLTLQDGNIKNRLLLASNFKRPVW